MLNLCSAIPRNVIIASFGPLNYPLEKRKKVAKIFSFLTQKITKVLKIATTGLLIVALAWFRFFSIVLQSEPSSALPYNLVFRTKKKATVVGEHVVRSNSAYHCSGNNRHKFKHEVVPASAGRRFFVRVGLN